MKTETHIQSNGPICRRDGSTEWEYQAIHWEYDSEYKTAKRVISEQWRIIEHADGRRERIELKVQQ